MIRAALVTKNKNHLGQAVLLVMLGMAVALTVVVSIISSSVLDVSLTETEEESFKAFSAAEAGIENFLSGGIVSGSLSETGASFNVESSELGAGASIDFADLSSYKGGDVATVWFVSHQDDDTSEMTCTGKPCFDGSSFDICWGSDENDKPAIEVLVFYGNRTQVFSGDFSSVGVKRYAFDPLAGRSDGFVSVGSGCLGYNYSASISDLPSGLLFARVRFIYNNNPQAFAVQTGVGQFPSQARVISSLGTAGESSRRVEMVEMYREPVSFLDAGLASLSDIMKE